MVSKARARSRCGSRTVRLRIRQGDATVDFFLEARGESTIMRIVQSGFGADASFDDQYESTENGWAYFLYNLEHYLTRHRGQPRHMISLRTAMNVTREEAWPALTGPDSLDISPPQPSAGAPCRIRLGGRHYSGKVILCRRARVLACTVNELQRPVSCSWSLKGGNPAGVAGCGCRSMGRARRSMSCGPRLRNWFKHRQAKRPRANRPAAHRAAR